MLGAYTKCYCFESCKLHCLAVQVCIKFILLELYNTPILIVSLNEQRSAIFTSLHPNDMYASCSALGTRYIANTFYTTLQWASSNLRLASQCGMISAFRIHWENWKIPTTARVISQKQEVASPKRLWFSFLAFEAILNTVKVMKNAFILFFDVRFYLIHYCS